MDLSTQLLLEGIGERTLHHYTDMVSLFSILRDGTLKGFDYNTHHKGDFGKNTISTVRPGMANDKNLETLSGTTVGGVKIIIDGAKLSDAIRGMKIKPTAEFPIIDTKVLKHMLKIDVKVNEFANKAFKVLKGPDKASDEFFSKHALHGEQQADQLRSRVIELLKNAKKREGEERIVLKKGSDEIRIDPKYIKIELHDKLGKKVINSSRKKLLINNKKYFVRNDAFKELTAEKEKVSLEEYIGEAISPRELHHYTNYSSLLEILKSNSLKGSDYVGTKNKDDEISTVRPSMASKKNLAGLSSNTGGGVKIIFDGAKLSDTVRRVKLRTIAEYPVDDIEGIEYILKNSKLPGKTEAQRLMKRLIAYYKKNPDDILELGDASEIEPILEKYGYIVVGRAISLKRMVKDFLKNIKKREGEERIVIKRGDSIPLNPKYLKIELVSKMSGREKDRLEHNYKLDKIKVELKQQLKKNKNLFVQNDIYKEMIK
jgi:hypothetical protein